MDFGEALRSLKAGNRVYREGWNGKGMWIALSPGYGDLPAEKFWSAHNARYADRNGGHATVNPSITIKNADGTISFWAPSIGDALAEDWCTVAEDGAHGDR